MPLSDTSKTITARKGEYNEDYVLEIFTLWYTNGKPPSNRLLELIETPDPFLGTVPSEGNLKKWIANEFAAKAMFVDQTVAMELEKRLVNKKILMLENHALLGQELHEMGMEFLRSTDDDKGIGNSRNALTAVIKGIEIEKTSRGAPVIMERLSSLSDQQLVEELEKMVEEADFDVVDAEVRDVED